MKFTLKGTVPDCVKGLTLRAIAPDLATVEAALETATKALADAKARAFEAASHVDRLRREVATGRATTSRLQAAVDHQRVTALAVAGYEAQLETAKRELETAHANARKALRLEAQRRHDELRAIAEQVSPLLMALRDAEGNLDHAIASETRHTDGRGCMASEAPTPALEWPASLMDDALRSSAQAAVAFPTVVRATAPPPSAEAVRMSEPSAPSRTQPPAETAVRSQGYQPLTNRAVQAGSAQQQRRDDLMAKCSAIRDAGFPDDAARRDFDSMMDEVDRIDGKLHT